MNTDLQPVKASAPGSLMLLGEHAVLHGRQALVCAVSRRARVIARQRSDGRLRIRSNAGEYESAAGEPHEDSRFRYLLSAYRVCVRGVPAGGVDLVVESDIPMGAGLSSSAAVTVAATAALSRLQELTVEAEEIFSRALEAVRAVQPASSGADVAAAVWGGMLVYRTEPQQVRRLAVIPPLVAVYSGVNVETSVVVGEVEQGLQTFPRLFQGVFDLMDASVTEAERLLEGAVPQWEKLGALLDFNQGLMEALGVSRAFLADLVYSLRDDPGILGAKISGAGMGDCVVGLGVLERRHPELNVLEVAASAQGLEWDG